MMDANEYQRLAGRTLIDRPDHQVSIPDYRTVWNAALIAAQAGQIADIVKKGICHQHGLDPWALRGQVDYLGDLLTSTVSHVHAPNDQSYMLLWNGLGLAGEAGEVLDLIADGLEHGELDEAKLKKELGDVLWYVAALCSKLGFALADVMQGNIDKLAARYGAEGYTAEQSRNRAVEG